MLNSILQDVMLEMSDVLDNDLCMKLQNVLYMKFKGKKIQEESYEIAVSPKGNEMKIKMFVGSKKTTGRKNGTLKNYVTEIRNLLLFTNKNIEDITAMDIRCFYAHCQTKNNISLHTTQTRLHYLSSFWEFLNAEGLVNGNPLKQIGHILLDKIIKKPYTQEELEALRSSCDNERDRALLEFLYSTGVRVSELTHLNVGDINFGTRELIVFGKGSKQRIVYLTDTAKYYLFKYLGNRKDEFNDLSPLFVSTIAPFHRLTPAGVQFMLKKVAEKANVKHVHPHRFRRTIATDLLSRGMPLEEVKEYLGHEKVETTLIYCKIKQESVKNSFLKYA